MKKVFRFLVGYALIMAFPVIGFSQWATSGSNIYNTNSGNVGIGNNSPATLLHVGKNMTEPTIRIQNFGGYGGATYQMVDIASGADWKFKATYNGGFKIRDHGFGLDVITIEPNSSANVLYINSLGHLGIGTVTPTAELHVSGTDGALFTGVYDSGTIPLEGQGTRMMWYPRKAAFRVGKVLNTKWNDSQIGTYSFAGGNDSKAQGSCAFAFGGSSDASGEYSVALGYDSQAAGDYSFAFGSSGTVNGNYSVLFGLDYLGATDITQSNTMAIMGGKVGIGTVSPLRKFEVHDNINSYVTMIKNKEGTIGDGLRITLQPTNPTSDNRYVDFLRNGGSAYAGWICGDNSGGVLYNTTSDERLKMNIRDYDGALEALTKVRVRQYEMKSAPGREQIGFIAQELLKVFPEAVSGDPGSNIEEEHMGVDYGRITPLLVKAIQEQQEMIEELQTKVAELKLNQRTAEK